MGMMDLAQQIIAVAGKNNKYITGTQLQIVMYFSLKFAMNERLLPEYIVESIYDDPFLVWRYGPVVESVHTEFKCYGATPIIEDYKEVNEFNALNNTINELIGCNPFGLIKKATSERFWKENSNKIVLGCSNVEYSLEDIK